MLSTVQRSTPTSRSRGFQELDSATLERCVRQDPVAFRAFVVRYERPVFALLSRMLGHGPHVEDLAQEVFLKAYRAFGRFDVNASARASTWLLTIAARLALDASKKYQPRLAPLEAGMAIASTETPAIVSERALLGRRIAHAAARLSNEQRIAFIMTEYHGLSQAEVAEALGVPQATVKTRLFRARQRLRELLSEEGDS